MKRIILPVSLALTLSCGAAFAQQTDPVQTPQPPASTAQGYGHPHHAPSPQKQAEHLGKQLNLTPDQTARIEPIFATRDQQMEALRGNEQLTPQDRHQQMRTINQTAEQGMAGVLTPEQMAQLKAMRHNERGHHGPEGQPGNSGQSPS